ncbi:MAG TPA: RNA-binding domain-containing protein, partial [Chthonomonadaceae bacterium]|nr:RNA-binding domain-containing protein [Chthonomonadaceae bacterium]
AAMKTLINIYSAVTGRIDYLNDAYLSGWLHKTRADHESLNYYIKRTIITNNLFGVDIMEEACEIAKLRLFLALVSSAQSADQLEPLPNIDFNILAGNSLVGLLHVDDVEFNRRDKTGSLFSRSYREVLEEKNRLVRAYRDTAAWHRDLQAMRDQIAAKKAEAKETLDELLLEEFKSLGVKFEQATWDAAKGEEGKPVRRALALADVRALHPFHWGYEFDEALNARGGFDAIITNPPWEIFKPNSKEFFMEHSELVTKNKMTIKEFEEKRGELLQDPAIRAAWLACLSQYPHVSAYYRSAQQYENQISIVNGKKAGTDINLYKLFVEQCYNLLRPGGQCGIVVPSGLYTDLGTKQLRELLFGSARITGLICFENRKMIFEGVDSRFKFIVLTLAKEGRTDSFPAAFMRHDVAELATFPKRGALDISVDLIRRLSPDSLSVMEFKSKSDVRVAEKAARFPSLGETVEGSWQLRLSQEIHMTNDSHLFETIAADGSVPLVQGGMFHQFNHDFARPKYWLDPAESRREVLGKLEDTGQTLAYQDYRLVHRRIARNTDNRTLIATVLPPNRFCADTAQAARTLLPHDVTIFISALFNSFVLDAELRKRVTTHCDMHFMYALRLPRLTERDPAFRPIVERAARLICTTPKFDDLAREVGLTPLAAARAPAGAAEATDGLLASAPQLVEVGSQPGSLPGLKSVAGMASPPARTEASTREGGFRMLAAGFNPSAPNPSAPNPSVADPLESGPALTDAPSGSTPRPVYGVTDPAGRARLRAELDALVARLYGLTEAEFAHVLASFPLVAESVKADALAEFRKLQPAEPLPPSDTFSEETARLIREGENESVEFKRTLEYVADEDLAAKRIPPDQKPRIQKDVVHSALKTICAFLNSAGGTLLIGVHDEGHAVGIENDLSLLGRDKRTADGFELKLRALLKDRFEPLPLEGVAVRFPVVEGRTLCRVDLAADPQNIYHLDGKVYVRHGNQTLELAGPALTHWIRRRGSV